MSQKSNPLLNKLQYQQHYQDHINTSLESNYRHSSQHKEKKFDLKLQKSVVELYEQIKSTLLKKEDQLLLCQIRKLVPLDKQQDLYTDPSSLIRYIGCIFTIVLQNKFNLEQQIEDQNSKTQNDYEVQLIKLEAEIRQHIRIEQQIKLFAENTQSKLEDANKIKKDLQEQLQTIKNEFQILNEKNNILNEKLKTQGKTTQNIQLNSIVDLNSQINQQGFQCNKSAQRKDNIENEFPKQQSIQLNFQKDRSRYTDQEYGNRLLTESEDEQIRNDSKKRLFSINIYNNNSIKTSNLACRVQTETNEYLDKKRKNNSSQYETSQIPIKNYLNQTSQNGLNLIKDQEFKRQQQIKGQSENSIINSNKPYKLTSLSQHTDVNRSNNFVHSYRKQHPGFIQIPRPFSCAEQFEIDQYSLSKDFSVDLNGQSKQNTEYLQNQIQIRKLLQQYQLKHSQNDSLNKKLHQEYKRQLGMNCKTIN
ncbi:unnamed protein product [Paramecium sonneborni]|uniref:Uncharacterized protein n=1 Tax=Paramecium sonneborni TaxID=65129 RepID=A0A8S1P825_9CILI|nr:unnamed protein product [Paramecium sonneborni]